MRKEIRFLEALAAAIGVVLVLPLVAIVLPFAVAMFVWNETEGVEVEDDEW